MNTTTPQCEKYQEDLSLLAADCLSPEEKVDIQTHVSVCPHCRERWEQLQIVCVGLRTFGRAAETDVSSLIARVTAATTLAESRVTARFAGLNPATRWLLAVSLLGLLVIAYRLSSPSVKTPRLPPEVVVEHVPALPLATEEILHTRASANESPTYLKLRTSFAQSDDQFETMLALDSLPLFSEPLSTAQILQESF
jgi:Putative zinc-finger